MDRKLILDLFEMFRDLVNKIEPTEANTKKMAEWSQRFHAEDAETPAPPADMTEAEDDDEPDADHEHGARQRSAPGKRRR